MPRRFTINLFECACELLSREDQLKGKTHPECGQCNPIAEDSDENSHHSFPLPPPLFLHFPDIMRWPVFSTVRSYHHKTLPKLRGSSSHRLTPLKL